MTDAARQPKDENYNLIAVLYQSSDNVGSLKTYIQNAQHEGNQELVEFFGGILENNLRVAQRVKEMLVSPLSGQARVAEGSLLPPRGLRARAARAYTFCSYSNAKTAGSISLHQRGPGRNAPALC
jgi:hypothetical protein